jgi:hypothetical protein
MILDIAKHKIGFLEAVFSNISFPDIFIAFFFIFFVVVILYFLPETVETEEMILLGDIILEDFEGSFAISKDEVPGLVLLRLKFVVILFKIMGQVDIFCLVLKGVRIVNVFLFNSVLM